MHLAFTPLAEQDLEAIADYIAADNPELYERPRQNPGLRLW